MGKNLLILHPFGIVSSTDSNILEETDSLIIVEGILINYLVIRI